MQISSLERVNRLYAANSAEVLNPVVRSDREGDTVSLSPKGLRAACLNGLGLDPERDTLKLEDLKQAVEQDRSKLKQMLTALGEDLGLTRLSFELSLSGGNLRVSGNLPECGPLQEIFNDNSSLRQTIKRLNHLSGLLKAAQNDSEFQQAGGREGQQPVEDYLRLLNEGQNYGLRVSYNEGRVSCRLMPSYA